MNSLVELYHGKEPVVKSFHIWKKFGYKDHDGFKKVVNRNKNAFSSTGFPALESGKPLKGTKGGRPEMNFVFNERQYFMLVLLVKNTPESIDLKIQIEAEFFRMRNMLATMASTRSSDEWQNLRKDGKAVYLQKTDVIKQFVDYATAQGSKSANMYYMNLAQMENKALFLIEQKYPNVREVLNIRQLMQVATADQIVEKALGDGMARELAYKEIYTLAKDRVIKFSEILGKSLVTAMLETPKLN
jgi:phage regulator Rha-like protein